jgi:hypothetical protein
MGNVILPTMKLCRIWGVLLLIASLAVLPVEARVLRVDIASRTDVLSGKVFGSAGSYELLTGRVYFSFPIANPHNIRIVDLPNAVNLKNGEVQFATNHRSAGDLHRLELARSIDRRARSVSLVRGFVPAISKRPPLIAESPAIRARRLRNVTPAAKTISLVSPARSMIS